MLICDVKIYAHYEAYWTLQTLISFSLIYRAGSLLIDILVIYRPEFGKFAEK